MIDFEPLFRSCTRASHVKRLHALLVVAGTFPSNFVSTRLLNLYAHLGDVCSSLSVFGQIKAKDSYAWNSMVSAYVRNGYLNEAAEMFRQFVLTSGLRPDVYTFPPVIKACRDVVNGKKLHSCVLKLGFQSDVFVAASLVHMYTRFGFLNIARNLFDEMPCKDLGSWNAMISGYCQNGDADGAMSVLDSMRLEGVKMDSVTVCSLLPICAQRNDLTSGMLIHLYVIKHGLEFDMFVNNALINMYAKFGLLSIAQWIFDGMGERDLVSWNSLVAAYEQNDDPATAFGFFRKMQENGVKPDILTLVSLAPVVGGMSDSLNGKSVHSFVVRRGWMVQNVALGNAIMDMYAKLGIMDYARKVFEELPVRDVISWNTLITGYAQNGLASEAIEVYETMEEHQEEVVLNQGTWVAAISAYSSMGAVKQGMRVHGAVIKNNISSDVYVGTCLIDMYGKCGEIDDAMKMFLQVPRDTSVPWNAIISCHGIHGHGKEALAIFEKMQAEGVKPDHITFVALLSACSHSGMVDEGQRWFQSMQEEFAIKPGLKHFGCMVDLLGRAGHLEKAYDLIKSMPFRPDSTIWGALLGACKIHGNVEMGAVASKQLFEVDSENTGYYVLLSNIFANVGKWEGVKVVRSLARDRGLKKTPGWSSIEVNGSIDVFYMGNRSHPRSDEIYQQLRILTAKIKSVGYVPDYRDVLQDVEDDEKDDILASHSERLAIAFGIISTPPKTALRIFKNLRVCGDCHTATKLISSVTQREIIVRDSNRFHHFRGGACSCGDYW
ncbi:hypothetical protein CRG98_007946 [Punica granatum]|uniref:DYW domain-containing protein n=1 Tax=Punica granatum TaxID=22663 RepID=A0A2I0KTG7_PUNGR|nr:hypothetical protein CRG98_007946 [Punica granatum]